MSTFTLGQKVRVHRELSRVNETRTKEWYGRIYTAHWKVWKRCGVKKTPLEGIVIGTRTLMNVEREFIGYEEGWDNNLGNAERFQAVWVAFDMRRKPVFALPEDVEAIDG